MQCTCNGSLAEIALLEKPDDFTDLVHGDPPHGHNRSSLHSYLKSLDLDRCAQKVQLVAQAMVILLTLILSKTMKLMVAVRGAQDAFG